MLSTPTKYIGIDIFQHDNEPVGYFYTLECVAGNGEFQDYNHYPTNDEIDTFANEMKTVYPL